MGGGLRDTEKRDKDVTFKPKLIANRHETFGIIYEEFDELKDAMHRNDGDGFKKELLDMSVWSGIRACIP